LVAAAVSQRRDCLCTQYDPEGLMMFSLGNYFNRRSLPGFIGKRYAELLFRGRQFVESAEANEAQGITYERLSEVGDGAFGPISLREGGAIVIDQAAGTVLLGASTVWAGGYMHQVPEVTLTNVPMTGTVSLGVSVTKEVVTDVEDAELKGIVPGTASQGEALAARLTYNAVWATDGDPFYPVYTLIDGQLPNEVLPPQDSAAELAVERHVMEDHGSHIVDGFQVSPAGYDAQADAQVFVIAAGTLRAEGRRVHRSTDQRYTRVEDPTIVQVNGETQIYPDGGVVTLNNGPIAEVQTVTVIKEVTRTVTHQLAGGIDALPDTPVYELVSMVQGGTTFVAGTDYVRDGDGVSWAPGGAEPSPGSSYDATYRYVATVVPNAIGRFTISLEPAVEGEPVTIQYSYKLRRIDVLAIDLDGSVVYLKGLSNKYNPVPPCGSRASGAACPYRQPVGHRSGHHRHRPATDDRSGSCARCCGLCLIWVTSCHWCPLRKTSRSAIRPAAVGRLLSRSRTNCSAILALRRMLRLSLAS
jgi:hypothetical protein